MLFIVIGIFLLIWGRLEAMRAIRIISRRISDETPGAIKKVGRPKTSFLYGLTKSILRFNKLK